MGKKKMRSKRFGDIVVKPQPLAQQIIQENLAAPSMRVKQKSGRIQKDDEYVEGTLGRSIMQQGLAQMREITKDDNEEWPSLGAPIKRKKEEKSVNISLTRRGFKKNTPIRKTPIDENSDSDGQSEEENEKAVPLNSDKVVMDFEAELDIETGDLEVLQHFMKKDAEPQRRLCDIFRDKITEKQTELQTEIDAESVMECKLSPALMKACSDIAVILSRYRTGKLPKVFKSFPKMRCWEELLFRTDPDKWTAAAMYQVTRLFVSNLKASMAQRFCHLVLLPRVRDDIAFYKRLNFHLYQSLIKALFKPAAFFKGIVLPLCESGNCTLREAILIGSVIAKNHVPITFSAAAVVKIASMEYSGANSIFLRILFDKKYALPYQVLDECVEHFKRFEREVRTLPVLWHQSLLSFVQRYKNDISPEQKQDILTLAQIQRHNKISPQIHRELESAKCREPMIVD